MTTNNSANTYIVPTTANEVTMPSQPAFLAYLATTDADQTGNAALYTLGSGNALTEVFDQNADFNTNGTFTAPVTGRYLLTFNASVSGLTQAVQMDINIVTSNRSCERIQASVATAGSRALFVSYVADMDAADTATYTIKVSGEVGNTGDILGAADMRNNVSGCLVA